MGQEIVYCNNCQTRLLGSDFDKGKAFRVEHQNLCLDCAQKLLGTLPPAERDAFAAKMKGEGKKHSTVKIPVVRSSSDSGGHSRLMRAPQFDATPTPPAKRSPALVFALVGGVVALLILGIVASSSSPSKHPTPPPDSGGGPPPPPLPPSPGGNASADARRDLEQARAWAKANPDDFAGQIDRYQKTAWRPDAGPVAEEAKREVEAVNARQAARITKDLADLDARVRGLTDRGEHGVAMKTIEADRARHATQDWTLALKRRSDAVVVAARARAAELRTQASQSRNDASALRTLRDRTATLGFPEFLSEFDAAASAPTPPLPPGEAPPLVIYDDALRPGWLSHSWESQVDLKAGDALEGSASIAWIPKKAWCGLYLGNPTNPPPCSEFSAVEFAVRTPRDGLQLVLTIYGEGDTRSGKQKALELGPAGQWKRFRFAMSDFAPPAKLRGFILQSRDAEPAPIHVDEVRFLRGASGSTTPAADASPPLTGEAATWRAAWLRAAALAAGRDYAAAEKELAIALPTLKDAPVKAEAARDLADLKAAGALLAEALQELSKWPRGMNVAVDVLDAGGRRHRVDEPVRRVDGPRLEIRPTDERSQVEVGEILAGSLAELARPKDPRIAALLCALEGDLDGAKRFLPGEPPAAWSAHAATLPADADARAEFLAAGEEWREPATRVQAAGRYAALLRDPASIPLVRRLRASIAARAEAPREFFFATADLRTAGLFHPAKHPKGEIGWTMAEDVEDRALRAENHVEVGYSVAANAEIHAWILAGACCLETWSFFIQASDLEGPDPDAPTSIVPAEPGSTSLVPVPVSLPFLKRTHSAHGGAKAPTRFDWIPLPVLKHAQGGSKRLRVVSDQQGFTVVSVFLSTSKRAPPKDAELHLLEASRPTASLLLEKGAAPKTGGILREVWTGLNGDKMPDLTGNAAFRARPQISEVAPAFATPQKWNDNYGTRLRGWVVPPATGNYTFFLCTDDQGELWLSTDDGPAGKQRIASLDGAAAYGDWGRAASKEIPLVRGRLYYIEALHKEGAGDDHALVGWKLPDGSFERPIPGKRLVPWSAPAAGQRGSGGSVVSLTAPVAVAAGAPAALAVEAPAGARVEIFNGTQRLGEAKGNPSAFTWSAPPLGAHVLTARATERGGKAAVSAPVTLLVGDLFHFRTIDLNGPGGRERTTVVGTGWERADLELKPPADAERAAMLRSTVASREGTKVEVGGLPDGKTIVYLLATEFEAAPQAFDVAINGRNVLSGHKFAAAGDWARLGPLTVDVAGGKFEMAASKGTAHFAGLEIWTTGAPPRGTRQEKTEMLGGPGGNPFEHVRGGDFLVVGFRYTLRQGILKSIRPIFGAGERIFDGDQYGSPDGDLLSEMAKPGYAVGGIQIMAGADRVRSFKVIYMRIYGGRLAPADRYESPWLLGNEAGTTILGGDGSQVVGICGGAGGDLDRLGLIYLR